MDDKDQGYKMRTAIISDIHANLEAAERVMEDIERSQVHRIIHLGDMIGYGPEPEKVISLIRKKGIISIPGNHELGLLDPDEAEGFNPPALQALMITRNYLSKESLDYLRTLPTRLIIGNALFIHGCPPDLSSTYLHHLEDHELVEAFNTTRRQFSFTGHTHMLSIISYNGQVLQEEELDEEETPLEDNRRYIINVGSVGQPRDWDPRAKYVIWDTETARLDVRYVEYDIAVTVKKMARRGFLKKHADLLWGQPLPFPS